MGRILLYDAERRRRRRSATRNLSNLHSIKKPGGLWDGYLLAEMFG